MSQTLLGSQEPSGTAALLLQMPGIPSLASKLSHNQTISEVFLKPSIASKWRWLRGLEEHAHAEGEPNDRGLDFVLEKKAIQQLLPLDAELTGPDACATHPLDRAFTM